MKTQPKCTIVMSQYNRSDYTEKCVRSLLSTCMGRQDIELILIDSGSNPNEVEKLKDIENLCIACGIHPVMLYLNDNYSIGYNRNLGLKLAHGEYVFCGDNDVEFTQNWLDEVIRIYDENNTDLLGLFFHPHHSMVSDVNDDVCVPNDVVGSAWFTKGIDLYKNAGWFYEVPASEFSKHQSEDSQLFHRLKNAGKRIFYVKKNLCEHFGKIRSDGTVAVGF